MCTEISYGESYGLEQSGLGCRVQVNLKNDLNIGFH